MKNMTIENIAAACRGELYRMDLAEGKDMAEASCVVTDSRAVEKDGVFIAVKGERVDGHDFIEKAAQEGALAAVCERIPEGCRLPCILVKDSLKALEDIAEFYREQLSIPIVGVTGSVGKTSTKEMIASVLSEGFCTLKTEGNYNNEIGMPLTVLKIREKHEAAVLEMGISHFGEMHRLSKVAKPDICVITNIGQCHLENLGSREGILKAKSEIFDYMNPNGYIFVNGEDDMLLHVERKGSHAVIHFGQEAKDEIYASNVVDKGLLGSEAVIHMGLAAFPVEIPLPGRHMINNALAAAAVGNCLGLSKEQIKAGISKVKAVGGRSHVIALPSYTVIDDCYNANPVSMQAALDLLSLASGRKVAVLGDMFELGENEAQLHAQTGAYAAEKEIDVLICVGKLSRHMYEEASGRKKIKELYYFESREELLDSLRGILKQGDNVLVKASHGMQFEKVIAFMEAQ